MRTTESYPPTLLSVKQFAQRHPAFTEGSLRWLIFKASQPSRTAHDVSQNGINRAIVRIGRRVLIHEEAFFELLNEQDM